MIASALIIFVLSRQLAGSATCVPGFLASVIRAIGPATLGIYVIHALFLSIFQRLGFLDPSQFNPIIGIPAIALSVFAFSCLATQVLMLIPGLRNTVA